MIFLKTVASMCFILILAAPVLRGEVLFREEFNSLENWKPLIFPKIPKHTKYDITRENGNGMLRAEANASASGIIYKRTFDIYRYPVARWRWKITNVYRKGDAKTKAGDDYPIRIYIAFKYDPARATGWMRATYGAVKLIYGEYPPHSSLNYIWSSRAHPERFLTSPYTERAKMVLVEKGDARAGRWVEERVNVLADYRAAFGADPPSEAGIAIMADADNTGESAVSFVDFIEVGE